MTFSSKTALLATALVGMVATTATAQSNNATYQQVSQIQLTFPAADMVPVPVPSSWLDIQGVLNVTFGDVAVSNIGDKLTVAQVQSAPSFRISSQTPNAATNSVFGSGKKFTVAFLDAGVAGKNVSTEVFNHYLGNDFVVGSNGQLTNQTAARVAYGAPLPATNDGPHRYMQLVFQQFDNFTAPATPAAGSSISRLQLQQYYQQANGGLGKIVAANYIQIEVGNAAAPSSTAPVAQSSVAALASSKSSAAGSGSASSSGSSASATSSNKSGSGAMSMVSSLPAVSLAAMGVAAFLGAALL